MGTYPFRDQLAYVPIVLIAKPMEVFTFSGFYLNIFTSLFGSLFARLDVLNTRKKTLK